MEKNIARKQFIKKILGGGGYRTRTVRSVNQRPVPLSYAKEFLARVNKAYEAFACMLVPGRAHPTSQAWARAKKRVTLCEVG